MPTYTVICPPPNTLYKNRGPPWFLTGIAVHNHNISVLVPYSQYNEALSWNVTRFVCTLAKKINTAHKTKTCEAYFSFLSSDRR
jgi:hypothetical protein